MPVFIPFQRKIGCFTAKNAKKKNGYSIKITVLMWWSIGDSNS